MVALDELISNQSSSQGASHLPTELLLHLRSDLQSILLSQVADEAAASLFEYESSLVEGLCPDCYWWNTDIYGSDIWSWVEHGFRGACSCVVADDNVPSSRSASPAPGNGSRSHRRSSSKSRSEIERDHDSRKPSPAKRRIQELFAGVEIESRGQWLRAYVSRKYFGGEGAWKATKRVLNDLGCSHRFEKSLLASPSSHSETPSLTATATVNATTNVLPLVAESTTASVNGAAPPNAPNVHSPATTELKKASHHRVSRPCDFGALVKLVQAPRLLTGGDDKAKEDASVSLARVKRELCIRPLSQDPDSDEPRIPTDCEFLFLTLTDFGVSDHNIDFANTASATRFVDQVYKRNACAVHFVSQRQPDTGCVECMRVFAAATGSSHLSTSGSFGLGFGFDLGFDLDMKSIASTVVGSAAVAYIFRRMASSF
jgi:hypothetical protein